MLATKVVFANYLYDACKYAECDFETVIDTFKSENEFGSSHWDVLPLMVNEDLVVSVYLKILVTLLM